MPKVRSRHRFSQPGGGFLLRLVAATLLLFPSIAQAEYFDTGNDIWNVCTDNAPGHNFLCMGMSTAYFDMMLATGYRCTTSAVDRGQVRDAILKYLSDNPGIRNMPASELAITSLTTAFQCVRPAPPPTTNSTISPPRSRNPKVKGGPVVLYPNH
jgi:hypothetical protein